MAKVFLECIPREEAFVKWISAWKQLGKPCPLGVEEVPVNQALGRVLARAVYARFSVPHYAGSAMDGLAVKSSATAGASPTSPLVLVEGRDCVPVDTGDCLPVGFDGVIMIEDTHRVPGGYEITGASVLGQHVRPVGEDILAGRLVLAPGRILDTQALAAALACGNLTVFVQRRPRVALIPTGDEIVPPGTEAPAAGKIPEFNSLLISGILNQAGAEVTVLPICPDRPELIKRALGDALADHDLCIINAGSSAGRDDYAAQIVSELGDLVVHGVAIRPGAPVVLGVVGHKPVLGVPGYPVSAALVTRLFALPVLGELTGVNLEVPPALQAVLTRRLPSPEGREEFLRVNVVQINGRWLAVPGSRGSGNLHSLAEADGSIVIPLGSAGLEAGAEITVTLSRPLSQLAKSILISGSPIPWLDKAALALAGRGWRLIQSRQGSQASLAALSAGECHLVALFREEAQRSAGVFETRVEIDPDTVLYYAEASQAEPWLRVVLEAAAEMGGGRYE